MTFGRRLRAAIEARGRLCVGIDPHRALLEQWGLPDDPTGLRRFALGVVEALGDRVAVLKPQSACFERHGSAGIAVLEEAVAAARELGALVILDVKRGDIGSTAQAYAEAYLEPGAPLFCDAITASPFLGVGSLDPLVDTALANGGGVFVLALTSNPEGARVQRAVTATGRSVAGEVLAAVAGRNQGTEGLGSIGAVVGATIGATDERLDVNGPLLVPGIGAQGGTPDDVRRLFGAAARNVLPSSSREILAHGPSAVAMQDAAAKAVESFANLASV
ncbi:MAG: orotidine-5'-phosphate decarboxylase [Nocardioidaceae bacterium]